MPGCFRFAQSVLEVGTYYTISNDDFVFQANAIDEENKSTITESEKTLPAEPLGNKFLFKRIITIVSNARSSIIKSADYVCQGKH